MVRIKHINHSSFAILYKDIFLISDLWLDGRIFNNSWDLISKTLFKYSDFEKVSHLWFSHEHPDHFYPPNIKNINRKHKENITLLYQKTIDKRVTMYCRNAGFKNIIELEKKYHAIDNDFEVLCEPATEGDSWICYKVNGNTILNTNDCVLRKKEDILKIKEKVGNIDVLLTKFSYASWSGNVEEVLKRKKIANKKLLDLKLQVNYFKPKYTIPIASYFYFCHKENHYMNKEINTAETVNSFLLNETKTIPIILYPNDVFSLGESWDSSKSINRYKKDYEHILTKKDFSKPKKINTQEIFVLVNEYISNIKESLKEYPLVKSFVTETSIFLYDHNTSLTLSIEKKIKKGEVMKEDCDVILHSESLKYCLQYHYGYESVRLGARIQKTSSGNYSKFYNFFRIRHLINRKDKIIASNFMKLE